VTISDLFFVESTHFYGGTVTWKTLNNTDLDPIIPVMFTQSYQWRLSSSLGYCNESYILNRSPTIPASAGTLQCVTIPASSCGGYTPVSASEYCTDFSTFVDSSSGQISQLVNVAIGSSFCVAFQSGNWIPLETNCGTNVTNTANTSTISTTTMPSCYSAGATWSIGCCVDLSIRPGGFINTPPVVTIISRMYILLCINGPFGSSICFILLDNLFFEF
jgi:hypothetical protein